MKMKLLLLGFLPLMLPARAVDDSLALPQLVEKILARDEASQSILKSSQYHEKLVLEQIGEDDKIAKKQESEMIIRPGGTPEVQVLSTHGDDLPSDPDEAAAQAKGQEEQRKRTNISLRDLAGRFQLLFLGKVDFQGEPVYLIGFEPKLNQPYKNQTERVLNHLRGRMWVRARDAVVLKTEATLAEPTEIAWIFASIKQLDFQYDLLKDADGIGPCQIKTYVVVTAPFFTFRQRMMVDMFQFEARKAVPAPICLAASRFIQPKRSAGERPALPAGRIGHQPVCGTRRRRQQRRYTRFHLRRIYGRLFRPS